ncbi:hypothetical protein Poly41_09280 [Novipirellula artificiosorum]|uniref:Uncharacterized protein n=1 Tax=Novipirellula artificiosorum TaxID=2528016 RepID=A0A5C6E653_9BACT|nr:hypothetical protein Poly41_09280 [Novipirellula artificiosorum]
MGSEEQFKGEQILDEQRSIRLPDHAERAKPVFVLQAGTGQQIDIHEIQTFDSRRNFNGSIDQIGSWLEEHNGLARPARVLDRVGVVGHTVPRGAALVD